ncbi:MAG: amino acid permease, partial [Proteobacteria bacterium]|nr:amino acid permease [Pseudomonadota bacterium]
AAINVIPFMIQRSVPGIGPWVLPAYLFAAVPALIAALAYAILASAMPRAGGSYVYASRALHPYLGFVASFSQWFGLSIAIGVVSYLLIPFLRDIATAVGQAGLATMLETGVVRVTLALAFLWTFVWVNLRGLKLYERTLVPMMFLMFALGSVVIVAGFAFDHEQFAVAVQAADNRVIPEGGEFPFRLRTFLAAAAVLFSSFIGFDSIAQAGGEARNPHRSLPLAIGIAVLTVGTFYLLFTAAVYHAVPWRFIAEEALTRDLTAPGLLGYLLPTGWTVAIVAGAAVALILAADIRIAGAQAEFAITPARLGLGYPREDVARLEAQVGRGMAALLLFTGDKLRPDEVHKIGLVELKTRKAFDTATAMASAIAGNAPAAIRLLKRTLGGERTDKGFEDAFGGAEFAEGLAAFRARRSPAW